MLASSRSEASDAAPRYGPGDRGRSATFGLRFRAYGKREYVTLGTAEEGWTRAKTQTELQNVLADVRRGIWQPPVVEVVQAPRAMPTFHEFASEWFERQKVEGGRRGDGLSDSGKAALRWVISNHLLPAFAFRRLDQITVEDVDRYRLGKVREGKLGVTSINKTLAALAAILETAVEYELIDRNPRAAGDEDCRLWRPDAPGSIVRTTSQRYSMPPASSTRERRFAPASDVHCSQRSLSPACGSGRRSPCAGATWTSHAAR